MIEQKKRVNVAPTSDEGHYIENAISVVDLDSVTESFFVKGSSQLTTKNHTTIELNEDCLINCQMVWDPFEKMHTRARD